MGMMDMSVFSPPEFGIIETSRLAETGEVT
jgi:hypothetical protein